MHTVAEMYPDQSQAVQFDRPVSAEDRQSFFNSLQKQSASHVAIFR